MDERQGRAIEVATQRRRRTDDNLGQRLKMAIPEEVKARLDTEGRTARWANDVGNRIGDLTIRDDYDKVAGVEPVPVGTDDKGQPILAHLLSKPTAFIEEDQAKRELKRRETEQGMLKGHVPSQAGAPSAPLRGQAGAEMYIAGSTGIGRGNKIIE